jgi:hypothetical protein
MSPPRYRQHSEVTVTSKSMSRIARVLNLTLDPSDLSMICDAQTAFSCFLFRFASL